MIKEKGIEPVTTTLVYPERKIKTMNKVTKVIRVVVVSQCANYINEDNYCLPRDKACMYFSFCKKLQRCRYLEESILPDERNNPARTLYYASLDADREGRMISNKIATSIVKAASRLIECERCKTPFKPTSNRHMYCERCSKIIRREKTQQRVMKLRKNTGVCNALGV